MKSPENTELRRFVDGLQNPKTYHRPAPKRKKKFTLQSVPWKPLVSLLIIGGLLSFFVAPRVQSFTRQFELLELLDEGRYLVLFQNDAEIRASGGFIGSFAVIETQNKTIKPLYFETNIYKLDDPFAALTKLDPPKPMRVVTGDRGWAMRDSNFAADFRQSAPTIQWFFKEEAEKLTGPKKVELDKALGGNYAVDGVVALTLSAFLDVLEATGPIEVPNHDIVVTSANFFPLIQKIVEHDYFQDEANRQTNEPKTVLQDLFPLAMQKTQNLPKTTQYRIATKLLREKRVIVYSNNQDKEQVLVRSGWAGALAPSDELSVRGNHDALAIIRSSHGGNKSSVDINPIYRYQVTNKSAETLQAKLEVQFEHTGSGEWPSGTNKEYIRVLVPDGARLVKAVTKGADATDRIDLGQENGQTAFGFTLETAPKTSQTMTLEYTLPAEKVLNRSLVGGNTYQLVLYRQPGGNDPDMDILYNSTALFQGRLTTDRVLQN